MTDGGIIYVHGTSAHAWRSDDDARSFLALGYARCSVPAATCTGLAYYQHNRSGGGDGDMAAGPGDTVYWLGLNGGENAVVFQVSHDRGETWSEPVDLAERNNTDRQWLTAGPQGELYAIWRDFGGGETFLDGQLRETVMFRSSLDGGETWSKIAPIVSGASPVAGKPAVDLASGSIYVVTSGAELHVHASHDGGASWSAAKVPSRWKSGGDFARVIFPEVAVDAGGTVYVAWAADERPDGAHGETPRRLQLPSVYVSRSTDRGATWSEPTLISTPGRPAIMPALVAGDAGQVALAWYEADEAPSSSTGLVWRVQYAQSVNADGAAAKWHTASAVSEPIHIGFICTDGQGCEAIDRSRGDFLDIALRANGLPLISFVIDDTPINSDLRRTSAAVIAVERGTPLRLP